MAEDRKEIKVKLTRNILYQGEHVGLHDPKEKKEYLSMTKSEAIDIVNMGKGNYLDDNEKEKALAKK